MRTIAGLGCVAAAFCILCSGTAHAAVTITSPGYYAVDGVALTLTPQLEWTDSSPSALARYKVSFAPFTFGVFTPTWTKTIRSSPGTTDYSVTYAGPALSWNTWYSFTVTRSSMVMGGTTATAFDYFMTVPVTITSIDYSGAESVTIENGSTALDVDMTGWRLSDSSIWDYYFPTFTLGAGRSVRVHTGSGTNTATDLYWGYDSYVWNDDGDTASLYSDSGELVDTYSY